MSRTIYKYLIDIKDEPQIKNMPNGCIIIHVGRQDDKIGIWAIVDTNQKEISVPFLVLGTGFVIPDNAEFIGTVQMDWFVWHLFKLLEG